MTFTETYLKGSYVVQCQPRGDSRGWFARTYCSKEFAAIGHQAAWVQMNHSFTQKKGSIRGMHFQLPPHGEIKMVRCVAGKIFDVIIDLRKNSPTFLQWFGTELSAENKQMLYIPIGFAHGFQTLTDDVELVYHHSTFYEPNAEAGILYNDSKINITWPLPLTEISDRDAGHALLTDHFSGL